MAEATGFCVPVLTGVLLASSHAPQWLEGLSLTAAGAIEGAVLGAGQAWAWPVPVRKARYVALTALGASIAWGSIMCVVQLADAAGVPAVAVMIAGGVAGLLALGSIGTAQWIELRHHVPRAQRFVTWTALAWLAALPLSFAPSPLVDETTPLATSIVLWSSSGVLMAFVMALVTWQGVRRLALTRPSPARMA